MSWRLNTKIRQLAERVKRRIQLAWLHGKRKLIGTRANGESFELSGTWRTGIMGRRRDYSMGGWECGGSDGDNAWGGDDEDRDRGGDGEKGEQEEEEEEEEEEDRLEEGN